MADAARVGKPAIQQTWKSALRPVTPLLAMAMLAATTSRADDYHVDTAQKLQNALSQAAGSSVSNNIYVTNGYYVGNFNFNSSNVNSLVILAETNIASSQVVIDSGGTGSSMNISGSATANITVQGMTFLRNCGSASIGGLRIAGGNTTILVSGCSFLSPTNSSGMGLLLVSGVNATVTNCTAAGAKSGGGGQGISISGIANITMQNCTITTNTGLGQYGGGLYVSGASIIAVTNCLFAGNTGGGTCFGAGAYCSGTTITLSGNTFTGNGNASSYEGGGTDCQATTVTLSGNTFIGNTIGSLQGGGGGGGGASCYGTTIILSGNTFINNSVLGLDASRGGGAACYGPTVTSSVTLSGNTFIGNQVSQGRSTVGWASYGGGAYCSGTATLSNNAFTGNSSIFDGGGAYCTSSVTNAITISGNTFQQNTAASGGGLYASGPTIKLLNNLIVKNVANTNSSQGGGIWVDATVTLNMINNTVTGNTSAGSGGGVAYLVTGVVELLNVYNNIIWGNLATVSGGDVYLSGTGQKKVFNFNDVDSMSGVWDIAVNNLDVSPQFFDPVNGDYHIQSTSSCKDAGTNGAPSLPATDLDGGPRIANGTVDLGCYEFSTAATHPADTNTDFTLTAAEFTAYAAAWKSGQPWSNAPVAIPADYVTRAGYLMTNGGAYHNDGSARPVNWKLGP